MKNYIYYPIMIFLIFGVYLETVLAQDREDFEFDIAVNYTMSYKKDSLSDKFEQVNMELLINNKQSLFRSEEKAKKDFARYQYLFDRSNFRGGATISLVGQFRPDYTIIKNQDSLFYFQGINAGGANNIVHFYYSESREVFNWQVLTDTIHLKGYVCQKAVLDYGGRHWEAWFSAEIPISDGPYKFCGLPGLIVKMEDSTSSWMFELTKFDKKQQRIAFNFDKTISYQKLTRAKFLEQAKSLLENYWEIRTAARYTNEEVINDNQQRKQVSAQVKRDNNWIELHP